MRQAMPVFLIIVSLSSAIAQPHRLTFEQLKSEMQAITDTVYRLNEVEVQVSGRGRGNLFEERRNIEQDTSQHATVIDREIVFNKVSFAGGRTVFSGFIFRKDVAFLACQARLFTFENCVFEGNVRFEDYETLVLTNCVFQKNVSFSGKKRVALSKCQFEAKTTELPKNSSRISFTSTAADHAVVISDCDFRFSGRQSEVIFFLKFSEINIRYCHFRTGISFKYIYVSDKFSVRNNVFETDLIFATPKFPVENAAITWADFAGKIAVVKDTTNLFQGRGAAEGVYKARSEADLADESNYEELVSVYSKFLQIFKFRSASDAYNQCYIEMKDLMTRKSAFEYKKKPTLRNFLDWKIKTFLRDFSDYGTDYTKSILYALNVILVFGSIFFLFPSDEDNLSRKNFFAFFRRAIDYFKTEKPLMQVYEEQREKDLTDLRNFRETLISSRKSIPGVIAFFAFPAYKIDLAINSLSLWALQNLDFVGGRWEDLSGKRKILVGIWVTLVLLAYIAWGIFMRALNAFALSLNSLTTLGYGGISAQGISRYLAVLEGLIGWFLLTIFSVSLIGQVL